MHVRRVGAYSLAAMRPIFGRPAGRGAHTRAVRGLSALGLSLIAIALGCDGGELGGSGPDAARDASSESGGPRDASAPDGAAASAEAGAADASAPGLDAMLPPPPDPPPAPPPPAPPPADAGDGCTTLDDPTFVFEVTDEEPSRQVALPLDDGVSYRSLTVETDVEPRWNGECFNPAGHPPGPMAVFQYLLEIRRGTAWCRVATCSS